jgi:hypothetical protein
MKTRTDVKAGLSPQPGPIGTKFWIPIDGYERIR